MDHNQHQFKLHKLLKHQYHLNQFLFSLPQTQDEAHPPWGINYNQQEVVRGKLKFGHM